MIGADLLAGTARNPPSNLLKLDARSPTLTTLPWATSKARRCAAFCLIRLATSVANGLAISNYAPIALENKERIEVLKGFGLQSGVSAPGGLVNYVTRRVPLRDAFTTGDAGHRRTRRRQDRQRCSAASVRA